MSNFYSCFLQLLAIILCTGVDAFKCLIMCSFTHTLIVLIEPWLSLDLVAHTHSLIGCLGEYLDLGGMK
jgi:hypothetical protein